MNGWRMEKLIFAVEIHCPIDIPLFVIKIDRTALKWLELLQISEECSVDASGKATWVSPDVVSASNFIYPGGMKGLVDLGGTRTYDLADVRNEF
ncbi:unnamed protein product [Caenorhabditis auriculariae]|uniref:Uncharacterized protein n=1 Tax=Caenorhabditis auriculariae TaxID=2777116 RepID=A0A8S1HXC9_9PELO|nr:unnamed protein product [Caenorhabditis auriculariae]